MKMAVATPNRFRGSIQDRKFHRHRHVLQDDFTLGRRVVSWGEFGSDLSHPVGLDQYYPVLRTVGGCRIISLTAT